MLVSCKRAVTTEELLEPLFKRSRLHDVSMVGPEEPPAIHEVQSLRQALEQSQDVQRRLQHSNQVLQEHLKVHLNACHLAGD
eukprot:Skav220130  [mRNA]  locus=scaffold731:315903:321762:- [translate_table: standard]